MTACLLIKISGVLFRHVVVVVEDEVGQEGVEGYGRMAAQGKIAVVRAILIQALEKS